MRKSDKKTVKVRFEGFWDGFEPKIFLQQFPQVGESYNLVPSREYEILIFGPFQRRKIRGPLGRDRNAVHLRDGRILRSMPTPHPRRGARTLFVTGENVEPDLERTDFAIGFSRIVDNPRFLRVPIWAKRLTRHGIDPRSFVGRREPDMAWKLRPHFANYIYSHHVAHRDALFEMLSAIDAVRAPAACRSNVQPIGASLKDKLDFQKETRLTIACENEFWPGYTTEKLLEAHVTGTVPIYWGDPMVNIDFNPYSFINISNFGSLRDAKEYISDLIHNEEGIFDILSQPIFSNDKLPPCLESNVVARFFSQVFDDIAC
ncbi:MAG: glycosyltransferase family 10 [Azospirillaceae bacterium]